MGAEPRRAAWNRWHLSWYQRGAVRCAIGEVAIPGGDQRTNETEGLGSWRILNSRQGAQALLNGEWGYYERYFKRFTLFQQPLGCTGWDPGWRQGCNYEAATVIGARGHNPRVWEAADRHLGLGWAPSHGWTQRQGWKSQHFKKHDSLNTHRAAAVYRSQATQTWLRHTPNPQETQRDRKSTTTRLMAMAVWLGLQG